MNKFYFTYGLGGKEDRQAFEGGWTEIEAPDRGRAIALFSVLHPSVPGGFLNCSMVYSEDEFLHTRMARVGNFGKRCVERITYELLESE